ncbi:hypothetical protein AC249_AIPGENE14422 [Exaiptasia diaphana]|nr:hypothetical protein AC249_AIPGENE14422 [Exaiptasia diaphana]
MNNRDLEIYNYMDYLFGSQPGDKWIYENNSHLYESLTELVSKGAWYDGFPSSEVMTRKGFSGDVVKHDMYDILYWRVEFIRNHFDVYARNGGAIENVRHGGDFDPYFSLRLYCLEHFPSTCDEEIDSIYFVDARPSVDSCLTLISSSSVIIQRYVSKVDPNSIKLEFKPGGLFSHVKY